MLSSFKARSITGILLVIIIISLILFGSITANILIVTITLLCAIEYSNMINHGVRGTAWNGSLAAGILPLALVILKPKLLAPYLDLALYISYGIMLVIALNSLFTKVHMDYKNMGAFISLFYIGFPMAAVAHCMVNDSRYEMEILLGIFILLWITDSGAYIIGSLFGKNKLLPRISPGKTIEGSIGAGIFAILTSYILYLYYPSLSYQIWLFIALIAWIMGTIGDLYESSIKRLFKVKDSGRFMPGHGGFLDRFDSFLFVAPGVLIFLLLLKII